MELLSLFHLNKKHGVKVFTPDDIVRMKKQHKDLIGLQNNIIAVNFQTTPAFTDPNGALTCLVVLTSDGVAGSLSHLQTDVDVSQYSDALSQLYKNKQGIPVCLVGGEADISEKLVNDVLRELSMRGFIVSKNPKHADIMGKMVYRISTLSADKVSVIDMPYTGQPYTTTLSFPQTSK